MLGPSRPEPPYDLSQGRYYDRASASHGWRLSDRPALAAAGRPGPRARSLATPPLGPRGGLGKRPGGEPRPAAESCQRRASAPKPIACAGLLHVRRPAVKPVSLNPTPQIRDPFGCIAFWFVPVQSAASVLIMVPD
eukprot:s2932_g2.t1